MRSFTLASLLIIYSLMFALPSLASGQGTTDDEMGFRISPVPASDPAVTASGYFIYKVHSSASMTGSVLLKNPSNVSLTIQLAAVDAITAQTGGSAFATSDVTPSQVATWLKFAESSVTLPAGREKPVDFTVSIPQSIKPGQYLAGISAFIPNIPPTSEAGQSDKHIGASLTTQSRYVIGVEVDIAGTWTPSLKIDSVILMQPPSGPYIGVHMKNDGDTFLKPSGTIMMTDTAGTRVLEQSMKMDTFVTGTDVTYPIKWSGVIKPGDYHVRVEMRYGENESEIAIYETSIKMETATTIAAQPQIEPAQLPGSIGGPQPPPGGGTAGQSPADASNTVGGLMVIFGSLSLVLISVPVALVLWARRRRKSKVDANA